MKLHYLPTYIIGDVHEKILGIPGDNYERAWTTFIEYYENQRRIVSCHVTEIFLVKSMKSNTSLEIKRITRETFNPITSLTSLNRAPSLRSDLRWIFTSFWVKKLIFFIAEIHLSTYKLENIHIFFK